MSRFPNTGMRYLEMVMSIPLGEWVSTAMVHQHIEGLGYRVHRRTIVRDLQALAPRFGIEKREVGNSNAYEWSRTRPLEECR